MFSDLGEQSHKAAGVGQLIFEMCKGVRSMFHSCASVVRMHLLVVGGGEQTFAYVNRTGLKCIYVVWSLDPERFDERNWQAEHFKTLLTNVCIHDILYLFDSGLNATGHFLHTSSPFVFQQRALVHCTELRLLLFDASHMEIEDTKNNCMNRSQGAVLWCAVTKNNDLELLNNCQHLQSHNCEMDLRMLVLYWCLERHWETPLWSDLWESLLWYGNFKICSGMINSVNNSLITFLDTSYKFLLMSNLSVKWNIL